MASKVNIKTIDLRVRCSLKQAFAGKANELDHLNELAIVGAKDITHKHTYTLGLKRLKT